MVTNFIHVRCSCWRRKWLIHKL